MTYLKLRPVSPWTKFLKFSEALEHFVGEKHPVCWLIAFNCYGQGREREKIDGLPEFYSWCHMTDEEIS